MIECTLRADPLHSLIVDPLFIRISFVGSPVIEANLRDLWELCGVVWRKPQHACSPLVVVLKRDLGAVDLVGFNSA